MNPIIFTVSPPGPTPPMTINLTALLDQFRTVPDQRTRRGVRYPLPVLLTIAVLAKLCGHSQMHAVADWATARAGELATLFGLPRPQMPHPTTWTRVFGTGVRATAVETALAPLLAAPPTHMVPPCRAAPVSHPDSRQR